MRPIELRLKNIGPFRNETIDFTRLGDMFLVCGKTGAGKSTIFSAITYALYGKLSGERSKVTGSDLRSDFVCDREEASITFTFMHHESCYKVRRILPSLHINRKQTQTRQAETVELYKRCGDAFEPLQNKKTEADSALESLMGLTVDEFSRIILLPQGEFAQFLRQNSKAKRETLLKLFPLKDYEALVQTVKEKADEHRSRLKAVEQQLAGFGGFDSQEQEETIREYEAVLRSNSARQGQLRLKFQANEKEIDSSKKSLQDFTAYDEVRRKLEAHLQQQDSIEQRERSVSLALKAAPVCLKIQEWTKAERNAAAMEESLAGTEERMAALADEREALDRQGDSFRGLREEHSKNLTLLHDLSGGLAVQAELDRLLLTDRQKQEELAGLQDRQDALAEERLALQERLESLPPFSSREFQDASREMAGIERKLQSIESSLTEVRRRMAVEAAVQQKERRLQEAAARSQALSVELEAQRQLLESEKDRDSARRLSETLQPGKACPVCGSPHHPSPAESAGHGEQVSGFDFQLQQEKIRGLEKELGGVLMHISREEGSLDELRQQASPTGHCPPLEVLLAEQERMQEERAVLECRLDSMGENAGIRNRIEHDLAANQEKRAPLQRRIDELANERANLAGKTQEKRLRLDSCLEAASSAGFRGGSLTDICRELDAWISKAAASIQGYEESCRLNQQSLGAETARRQEQEKNLGACREQLLQVEAEMERLLSDSGFASRQQAQDAYLAQDAIQRLQGGIDGWKDQRAKYEAQRDEIKRRLSGTQEETQGALRELEARRQALMQEMEELEAKYREAVAECEQRKAALMRWRGLEEARQEIQGTERLLSQLYTDISDKNPKRTAITTWILGVYLDQVVSCANDRLKRLSEGRYTLDFSKDQGGNGAKGLDLEVLDAYTGKSRPCSTLSGGETFMVSISLALALTDVVASKRGGISLQSLFIDEGFGSLDPGSLDKALSILEEIREGRCVGVISHVSEMQGRIPSRLEVIKTATGSSVRLLEQ